MRTTPKIKHNDHPPSMIDDACVDMMADGLVMLLSCAACGSAKEALLASQSETLQAKADTLTYAPPQHGRYHHYSMIKFPLSHRVDVVLDCVV